MQPSFEELADFVRLYAQSLTTFVPMVADPETATPESKATHMGERMKIQQLAHQLVERMDTPSG